MKEEKRGSADEVEVQDIKIMNISTLRTFAKAMSSYCGSGVEVTSWTKITTWLIPKKEGSGRVSDLRPIACLSHS